MDKYEMIDSIIVSIDKLVDARGVERCAIVIDITQRLAALKKGLKDDDSARNANIDMLKAQIKDLTTPPELKDGEIREGGQTYTIDLTQNKE